MAKVKLRGFASLPADTFAQGPQSGTDNGEGEPISANGRTGPFDGQPIQGFSGVQFAPDVNGSYWFLSDNGFGGKENSADYLLRIYQAKPNFNQVNNDSGINDSQNNASQSNDSGSIEIEQFIQFSDPDNLIPFNIVKEDTAERLLTGADFDIESFTIANDGSIWVGDEFGPYLLHFDSTGKLIEAPIPTPNITNLNTLNGQDPIVIGHRGASGSRPEHTLAAYELAIEQGANFIEPDLVATKDGVLIARHENALAVVELDDDGNIVFDDNGKPVVTSETTNIADLDKFADLLTVKEIDGDKIGGWFSEDLTLAEIKELRARERIPEVRPDNTEFNDRFEIPTLEEVIDLVKQVETETGKKIGIYPETKHPTYFAKEGTTVDGDRINISLEQTLIDTLVAQEFTDPNRIFIQSFEIENLIQLDKSIMPAAGVDIPLVQLLGDFEGEFVNDAGGGFSVPYDVAFNFREGNSQANPNVYDNFPIEFDKNIDYGDLANEKVIQYISTYADGLGPWKNSFLLRESLSEPVDGNNDGKAEISTQLTGEILPLVGWAHKAGMLVHPYTMRDEEQFLTLNPDGTPQTPQDEFEQLIQLGVDGYFTDHPETGDQVRDAVTADFVLSPQNPDVIANNLEPNLSGSRGFEGMAFNPDRSKLYPLLEGAVTGDPDNALRIYEFDPNQSKYTGLVGFYGLEDSRHAIGDFTPINDTEFLVIERDSNQGDEAQFKKIFKIDISQIDANGYASKEEVVDLLNIEDPQDLNSDGETSFDFPFVTIENVVVVDENTILVANDNNYPFSVGRGPDIDNNEIILLELDEPLNLDPRLGDEALKKSPTKLISGTPDKDLLIADIDFNGIGDTIFTGGGNDEIDIAIKTNARNNRVNAGKGDDLIFVSHQDNVFGDAGNDTFDASNGRGRNRISGGIGDDIFFLGENDRALGGEGDDQFYVQFGGDNIIAGGKGADQFWIANTELPTSSNTIIDFELGTDVIGILGSSSLNIASADDLDIKIAGRNTEIGFKNQTLAIINGIESTQIDILLA